MEFLLATYLTLFDPATNEEVPTFSGYVHSLAASSASGESCRTAWGDSYTVGQSVNVGPVQFTCQYMSTWVNGRYVGDSTRWQLSSNIN